MLNNLGDQWTYFIGLFLFQSDPFTDVYSCIHRSVDGWKNIEGGHDKFLLDFVPNHIVKNEENMVREYVFKDQHNTRNKCFLHLIA